MYQDAPDHANGIEIRRIGLFQFGFALRHEADALPCRSRR